MTWNILNWTRINFSKEAHKPLVRTPANKGKVCRTEEGLLADMEYDIHNPVYITIYSPETKNRCVSITFE